MNLALLGKNIQHSLSPSLYNKIIGEQVNYQLLDYSLEDEIPSLESIFLDKQLDGLNITAPYKTTFIDKVVLQRECLKKIGGINCIKKNDDHFIGENTDEMAFRDLFNKLISEYNPRKVIVLGSGTMAKMITIVTEDYPGDIQFLSRRKNGNIENLDSSIVTKMTLIINACSRDYVYKGPLRSDIVFWDMNYKMDEHSTTIPHYIDGEGLLELQARYAVDFFTNN